MQGMEEKPSSPFLGPARRGQRYVHSLVWPREAAGTEWWHFVGTARGCEHRLYVPPRALVLEEAGDTSETASAQPAPAGG